MASQFGSGWSSPEALADPERASPLSRPGADGWQSGLTALLEREQFWGLEQDGQTHLLA